MKHILLYLLLMPLMANAQLVATGDLIHLDETMCGTFGNIYDNNASSKTSTCGIDTVQYTLGKATGVQALNMNNVSSAYAICQYFNCPQPLTISGVEFFAYKSNITGGTSIDLTVQIYEVGPDSLPIGAPLASDIVAVDTTFGNGMLSTLSKTAMFTPVQLTTPYVVVLENNSPNSVAFVTSDHNSLDGQQEWLCGVNVAGTWLNSYNVNIGGFIFDGDLMAYPFVEYTLDSDFTASDSCFDLGPTIAFTNNSSPILQDRMYSIAEFLSLAHLQYDWDFGDGTTGINAIDTFHTYSNTSSVWSVTLISEISGWTSVCSATSNTVLGSDLAPGFSFVATLDGGLDCTDLSTSVQGVDSWLWDFGDGNTSTLQHPENIYTNSGTYTVCLTVTDICGSDSSCQSIDVVACSTVADFASANSDPIFLFTNQSTTLGSVNYSWDFGDGNTSNQQNPTNTYLCNGTYTVELIVTDDCEVDTINTTVIVSNGVSTPVALFNDTNNDPSFTFNNTSSNTSGATYSWDFGDGNTSSMNTPTHTYDFNGTYTVTLTVIDSCGTSTATSSITVNNACVNPIAAFTASGTAPTFTFTNTSTIIGSASNLWDMGDGTTYNTVDVMHTYTSNNTYSVELTVTDSCGTNTETQNVFVTTIGLNEWDGSNFVIYPNPTDDWITLESTQLIAVVSIYDIAGRMVITNAINEQKANISTATLAQGHYVLSALFSDGTNKMMHLEVMR